MRQQQSGFTLIEIAIVLVIIGLLLGGVLKGQELITQAKIKNVLNDFNGVSTAIYAYQDRYKKLPGDDSGAATRWSTRSAADSGNGDGSVGGAFDLSPAGAAPTVESQFLWADLRMAGFISGDTSTVIKASPQPANAVGGIIGVQWAASTAGTGGGSATSPLGFATPGLIICSTHLPGKIAESVDAQLDDGKSNLGSVRAYAEGASVTSIPSSGASGYLDDSTTLYTVCKSL